MSISGRRFAPARAAERPPPHQHRFDDADGIGNAIALAALWIVFATISIGADFSGRTVEEGGRLRRTLREKRRNTISPNDAMKDVLKLVVPRRAPTGLLPN